MFSELFSMMVKAITDSRWRNYAAWAAAGCFVSWICFYKQVSDSQDRTAKCERDADAQRQAALTDIKHQTALLEAAAEANIAAHGKLSAGEVRWNDAEGKLGECRRELAEARQRTRELSQSLTEREQRSKGSPDAARRRERICSDYIARHSGSTLIDWAPEGKALRASEMACYEQLFHLARTARTDATSVETTVGAMTCACSLVD